jgi:hypothetical protein
VGNYHDLYAALKKKKGNRLLILDNNNLEFCSQHEWAFPPAQIFQHYDAVLIPEWVYAEIFHSQKRLDYLSKINVPYFIMSETEDYPELAGYQEIRLMKLFKHASSSGSKARKYFSALEKYYGQHDDLPKDWIATFYQSGFDTKESRPRDDRGVPIVLKKNAGETSILVLAYLLFHQFHENINQVTIFSSDRGSLTIKEQILTYLPKMGLIHSPAVSISFKSSDILLIEAYQDRRIDLEDVKRLRKNRKSVIYTMSLEDFTASRHEYVMDTEDFLKILQEIDHYHFEF